MLILAYLQCHSTNVIALRRVYDGCRNPPFFFFLLVANGWFYIASKGRESTNTSKKRRCRLEIGAKRRLALLGLNVVVMF